MLERVGGHWRVLDDLEAETRRWVSWFNDERIHSELGDLTPVEAEDRQDNDHQFTAEIAVEPFEALRERSHPTERGPSASSEPKPTSLHHSQADSEHAHHPALDDRRRGQARAGRDL